MRHGYLNVVPILIAVLGVAGTLAPAQVRLPEGISAEYTLAAAPSWSDFVLPGALKSPDPEVVFSTGIISSVDEVQSEGGPAKDKRKLVIHDLANMVNQIARTESDKYDYSFTLLDDKSASIHLHVLGYGQTTPLHLHHNGDEATFIVTGKPHVTHIFGRNGKVEKLEGDYGAGTLIYSPRLCGHKWVNSSNKSMQANLVFASPPFVGNLYVDASEPRFKNAAPPLIVRPAEDLQRWLKDFQNPAQAEKLPMMNGKILRLLLRKQIHLPPSSSATVLYVIGGKGLLGVDQSYPLEAQNLALIPPHSAITIEANQGSPLVIIAFRPEAEWETIPIR